MIDLPEKPPEEYEASAAFYRAKAAEAAERANTAMFAEAKVSFLQVADGYEHLAAAIDQIAKDRSKSRRG
jgi:hypothetical protein